MRIGIDLRTRGSAGNGAASYLRGLAGGLLAIDTANEYHVFAERREAPRLAAPLLAKHVSGVPLPFYSAWHRLDLLQAAGPLPFLLRAAKVQAVPDISFEYHPGDFPHAELAALRGLRRHCSDADLVLACSALCRRQLNEKWALPQEKVVVAPPAADHLSARAGLSRSPASLGLPERYVVFAGGTAARHNAPRTIAAFDRLVSETRIPHHLVIVLTQRQKSPAFECALRSMRNRSRAVLFRNLSDADLHVTLRAADVFVCPWLYDGPGGVAPAIAQRLEVPCLVSDAGSFPETCADSVLYCDPLREDSIADGLERLLGHPLLRSELAIRGAARTREWSWRNTAAIALEAYRRLVRDRAAARSSPAVLEA